MPGPPTPHQIAFLERLQQSRGPISYREAFTLASDAFRGGRPPAAGDVWLPSDHRLWLDALAGHGWIRLVNPNAPDEAVEITERGRSLLAEHRGTREPREVRSALPNSRRQ